MNHTPAVSELTAGTPSDPASFAFVPGNYYGANPDSNVITQYGSDGAVVGSYTIPSASGDEVHGIAFGPDGLLYACMAGSSGFTVLALDSSGAVHASYAGPTYVRGNLSYGKIAVDRDFLYVCGQGELTRFQLGEPLSGTVLYTANQVFDVKLLPSGNLFVASAYKIDEIQKSGAFVRTILLTGDYHFVDIRGIEYNPATNILFVTHLGYSSGSTDFYFRIMRVDATTGALLGNVRFSYADDLFLNSAGNLLVGSRTETPSFFSQNLQPQGRLGGMQKMFLTQLSPQPAVLANISTRLSVQTNDNVLIGGFIITGTQAKRVIVRALGPSLDVSGAPVPGRLADTSLRLVGPGGPIASNDNWRSTQEAEIIASTVPPPDDLESAIVATLPANNSAYTVIVEGAGNTSGIGSVEVYDLDQAAASELANISTRGLVQTGDNVMIGGIILVGPGTRRVIVRALGPSLNVNGTPVPGRLSDTTLTIADGNGVTLAINDDWRSTQEAEIIATAVPPTNDLESAIVATLSAAPYTVIVRGKNGTGGVGQVEVYALAP